MLEQPALLGLGQLVVGLDTGRVLDGLLVDRHTHVLAARGRSPQRHKALLGSQQPGVDERPLRLGALPAAVDLVDRADLLAVAIDERAPAKIVRLGELRHGSSSGQWRAQGADRVWDDIDALPGDLRLNRPIARARVPADGGRMAT